ADMDLGNGWSSGAQDAATFFGYLYRIALADREWMANHVARAEEILDECRPSLRLWEWYHLKRRCRSELLSVPGCGPVAFSVDGSRLAAGGINVPVCVYDAVTGRELIALSDESGSAVLSLAFSPSSLHLAKSDSEGAIVVWDLRTGREILAVKDNPG